MNKKVLFGLPLIGGLFVPGLLSGQILLTDSFDGTQVDTGLWTESGWGGSRGNIEVTGGILRMNNNTSLGNGANDHKGLTSVNNSLNFHQFAVEVDVGIGSFAEPDWGELSYPDASGSMWFALGNVTTVPNARDNTVNAFTFNLTWRRDVDGIFMGSFYSDNDTMAPGESLRVANYLSDVPERINFVVDADTFTITLIGAEFLDEASGVPIGSSLTDSHSMPPQDNYYLTFGVENRRGNNNHGADGNHALIGEFTDITVIPEPSVYASILGLTALVLLFRRRRR